MGNLLDAVAGALLAADTFGDVVLHKDSKRGCKECMDALLQKHMHRHRGKLLSCKIEGLVQF